MKFIATEWQEELDRKLQRPLFKETENLSRKPASHRESKVFVWGLNDKEQLGGLKGSKVKQTLSVLKICQILWSNLFFNKENSSRSNNKSVLNKPLLMLM